jgi:hypothetical protein
MFSVACIPLFIRLTNFKKDILLVKKDILLVKKDILLVKKDILLVKKDMNKDSDFNKTLLCIFPDIKPV